MLDRARPLVMPTIYVDGGADFLATNLALSEKANLHPVISVGDGDSASVPMNQRLAERKDFSDLAFALRSLPSSVTALELFGFLGGRRDHELANFGEIHSFLTHRSGLATVNFHGVAGIECVAFTSGELELEIDGLFSVMVFERAAVLISGDCEYQSSDLKMIEPASSFGLSNVGHGRVKFSSASPCFIFLPQIL